MTENEAKNFLIGISYKLGNMAIEYLTEKDGEKMREAIKALEQEPFINKPCVSNGVCEHDKNKILDKIRAEIRNEQNIGYKCHRKTYDNCLRIIDKYKADSEIEEERDKK